MCSLPSSGSRVVNERFLLTTGEKRVRKRSLRSTEVEKRHVKSQCERFCGTATNDEGYSLPVEAGRCEYGSTSTRRMFTEDVLIYSAN
jgi:hypothetical protein